MVVLNRILKKSLASALFFLLALGISGVLAVEVKAQSNINAISCNLTVSSPNDGILAESGDFNGNVKVEDRYLPFGEPITWAYRVLIEGTDLSCSDPDLYFQLYTTKGEGELNPTEIGDRRRVILEDGTNYCNINADRTEMYIVRSFEHAINEDQVTSSGPGSLIKVHSVYLSFKVDETGRDSEYCKYEIQPNSDLIRSRDAAKCDFTQSCLAAGGRSGTQICLGEENEANACVWEQGANPITECSSCFICGSGTCYPGCSHLVAPSDPLYEPACAELETRDPICGDNVCEAGEGFCRADCMGADAFYLCEQIGDSEAYDNCRSCSVLNNGIWTSIGCIPSTASGILETFIGIGLSIGGGIALLTILAASYIFSTSQGDPKRIGDAKDMMTSAIIGLLFIIFSVTMLQFIGVTLLQIPGFGS